MNSCREFEGKNVDAAIELACKKLNISKKNIKYDIISAGSSGIFSIISRKKAKISVVVSTEKTESISSLVDEAFGVPKKENKVKNTPKNNSGNQQKKQTKQPQNKNTKQNVKKERPKKSPVNVKNEEVYPKREKIISDFFKGRSSEDIAKEVVEKILAYISTDIQIESEVENEVIKFFITGEDSAIIIGKRGQTLEAIQYIVDKIVNKHTLERKRVQIDVEGYLEKRRENLEKMALRMSEKVVKTGKPSTISQMSSQDRRIIHLTLKENKEIRTQSMGEGYYRRLVIFPKRGRKKKVKN